MTTHKGCADAVMRQAKQIKAKDAELDRLRTENERLREEVEKYEHDQTFFTIVGLRELADEECCCDADGVERCLACEAAGALNEINEILDGVPQAALEGGS